MLTWNLPPKYIYRGEAGYVFSLSVTENRVILHDDNSNYLRVKKFSTGTLIVANKVAIKAYKNRSSNLKLLTLTGGGKFSTCSPCLRGCFMAAQSYNGHRTGALQAVKHPQLLYIWLSPPTPRWSYDFMLGGQFYNLWQHSSDICHDSWWVFLLVSGQEDCKFYFPILSFFAVFRWALWV